MGTRKVSEPEVTGPPSGRKVLFKRELLNRIPYTYPTVWRLMRADKFPRARKLYGRCVWYEDEIDAFLNGLPLREYKRSRLTCLKQNPVPTSNEIRCHAQQHLPSSSIAGDENRGVIMTARLSDVRETSPTLLIAFWLRRNRRRTAL